MKMFLSLVCTASLMYGNSPELPDDSTELSLSQSIESEEVASLDMTSLLEQSSVIIQPPIQTEIQAPPPVVPPTRKQPWLAVTLSSLFPGLGHIYLEDPKTAGVLMGTAGLGMGIGQSPHLNPSVREINLATLQVASFYGLYAAYRDARLYNGASHYSYQMPKDSLTDLTLASFKWSVIKKPEVWGGVLGALLIGATTVYFAYPHETAKIEVTHAKTTPMPLIALPVGVGEESFFRGFLQSALCESLNPVAGIILSSLAFGAAHIPNAQLIDDPSQRWRYYTFSLPLITGIGAYCGWLTHKNRSLQESVAVHTWYDFILFSLGALANQSAATGRPGFAFAVPF